MLMWLILALSFLLSIGYSWEDGDFTSKDVNVTQFSASPGLHFHKLADVRLFNKEWKSIAYVDYNQFKDEFKSLKSFQNKTISACTLFKEESYSCHLFMKTSALTLSKMEEQLSKIENILGHKNTRISKRGWFDIIGKGAKVLFGTLDSDDAEYYNNIIQNANENEKTLTSLLKKQTNVVKSTITTFNTTLGIISRNEQTLFNSVNKITSLSNEQNKKIDSVSMRLNLDEHITVFNVNANQFNFEIFTLLSAVLDAKQGLLHPAILDPNQLVSELLKSINNLPTGLEFPLPLNEEYSHILLNLIRPICYFEKGNLVFILNIPLLEKNVYEALEINPLPVQVNNNKFAFIQPSTKILIIDQEKQLYTKYTEHQISKCLKPVEEKLICKQEQPLTFSHVSPCCEVMMYHFSKVIPDNCERHVTQLDEPLYIHLKSTNTWLFAIPNLSESITVNCKGSDPKNIKLKGSGCVSLGGECKGFAHNAVLIPQNQISFVKPIYSTGFVPDLNLKLDCCDEDSSIQKTLNITNFKTDIIFKPYTQYMEGMNIASHRLDDIRRLAEKEESVLKKHFYASTPFIAYILASLAVLYATYRILKYLRSKSCCGLVDNRVPSTLPNVRYMVDRPISFSTDFAIETEAELSQQEPEIKPPLVKPRKTARRTKKT